MGKDDGGFELEEGKKGGGGGASPYKYQIPKHREVKEEVIKCQVDGVLSEELIDMFESLARHQLSTFHADEAGNTRILNAGVKEAKKYWKHCKPAIEDARAFIQAIIKTGMLDAFTQSQL